MQSLNLGTTSAKRESNDNLLSLMRQAILEHPELDQSETVAVFLELLHKHEDYDLYLREAAEKYAANNIYRRCLGPRMKDTAVAKRNRTRAKNKVKNIVTASIMLWTWVLPTTGKKICDSTFQEVGEAAPLAGKFLARLSTCGAPGALVRDVFRNKGALQEYWSSIQ